ncbi:hypothetical protein RB653_007228 [Dictyostelium firmibasis]|uniref:Protein SYS1 homolog n=1 Tax=Dictyostelium firmibasis TaxID=79012 RepID=A0AAN7U0V2_9MYCE
MFYKYNAWDPKLIIGQILSIQCLYYILLAGILYLLDSMFSSSLSLEQMFEYQSINTHSQSGRVVMTAFLINSLFGSFCLKYIVERSKKCLDHSVTVTFIHFIIVCIVSGFPKTVVWWAIQLIGMVIMAMIGEYLCMRKELMDIPLQRGKDLDSTPITIPPSPHTSSPIINPKNNSNGNSGSSNNNNNNNHFNNNSMNSSSSSIGNGNNPYQPIELEILTRHDEHDD